MPESASCQPSQWICTSAACRGRRGGEGASIVRDVDSQRARGKRREKGREEGLVGEKGKAGSEQGNEGRRERGGGGGRERKRERKG